MCRIKNDMIEVFNRLKHPAFYLENKIIKNQESIIELSKSNQHIALNPVSPGCGGGHVEHYYHFVFDLLLPLSILLEKTASDVVFTIREFGVLTPTLLKIAGDRVRVEPHFETEPQNKQVNLIGMNPQTIKLQHFQFKNLKKMIADKLKVETGKKPTKILLIERVAPDEYYQKNARHKGAGSSRRSIKNHEKLKKAIQSNINPEYEFHNLKLENISFEEQVHYFDSAVMVIAQHGAGLANILWMPEKSIVVEIGFESKDHFKRLSTAMKHHYLLHNSRDAHVEINCSKFIKWLSTNKVTQAYFKANNTRLN